MSDLARIEAESKYINKIDTPITNAAKNALLVAI